MPQETEPTGYARSVVCVESKKSGVNVGGELGKGTVRDPRPGRVSDARCQRSQYDKDALTSPLAVAP